MSERSFRTDAPERARLGVWAETPPLAALMRIRLQELDFNSPEINHLRTDPRLLVFHWEGGKTYFPNNLVQFIRPAQNALVVAVGYEGSSAQGDVEAIGCLPDVDIIRDQEIEITVQLVAP